MRGRGHLRCKFSPASCSMDFVKTVPGLGHFGLDWLSELTQSSSPLLSWRNDAGTWQGSYPPASSPGPSKSSCFQFSYAGPLAQSTLLCLCTYCFFCPQVLPLLHPALICVISSGGTSRSLLRSHSAWSDVSVLREQSTPHTMRTVHFSSIGDSLFTKPLEGPDW